LFEADLGQCGRGKAGGQQRYQCLVHGVSAPRRDTRYWTRSASSWPSKLPCSEGIGEGRKPNSRKLPLSKERRRSLVSSSCTLKMSWFSRRPLTSSPLAVTTR